MWGGERRLESLMVAVKFKGALAGHAHRVPGGCSCLTSVFAFCELSRDGLKQFRRTPGGAPYTPTTTLWTTPERHQIFHLHWSYTKHVSCLSVQPVCFGLTVLATHGLSKSHCNFLHLSTPATFPESIRGANNNLDSLI